MANNKKLVLLLVLLPLLALGQVYVEDIVADRATVDNVRTDGNTISTINSNGNLIFDLNGTGKLEFTDLTASTVPYLDSNKRMTSSAVTNTELGYLSGVSSALQTQLNAKAPLASPTFTGTVTGTFSGNITGNVTGNVTGEASGNTKYTANQYGVVVSGSGNTMSVIAPDSSTTKVLTSGGSSANPTWQDPAAAPSSSQEISNLAIEATVAASAMTVSVKQQNLSNPSTGASAVKYGIRSTTATTGSYTQQSVTSALSIVVPSGATLGCASGVACTLYVYTFDYDNTPKVCIGGTKIFDQGSMVTSVAIDTGADSGDVLYCDAAYTKPIRIIGRITTTQATAGTWATEETELSLWPFFDMRGSPVVSTLAYGAYAITADTVGDLTSIVLSPGSWCISWHAYFQNSGAITTTLLYVGVGTASGTGTTGILSDTNRHIKVPVPQNSGDRYGMELGCYNVNPSTTTTYYLKSVASTSIANLNVAATMTAWRLR